MYNKSLWQLVCTAGIILAGYKKQGGTAEFTSLPFYTAGAFFAQSEDSLCLHKTIWARPWLFYKTILDKRIKQETLILLGNEVKYERQIKENLGQCP